MVPQVPAREPEPDETSSPEQVLRWASARFGARLVYVTGLGLEGCVVLDLIARLDLRVDVLTLDTELLFPETVALRQRLEERYGIPIRVVRAAHSVAEQAAEHGPTLWERDPDRCCRLRKVETLRRALASYDAWITSIRRDETRERSAARAVEHDPVFGLTKINPLLPWTREKVWQYVRSGEVPFNPLHLDGYPSIGCVPCTSQVGNHEPVRAGRWRGRAKTECGLHSLPEPAGNTRPS